MKDLIEIMERRSQAAQLQETKKCKGIFHSD